MQLNALGRHVALVGFMGAGKTTLGRDARRAARPAVPRPRPGDRGARRQDDPASSSPSAARPGSGGSRSTRSASRARGARAARDLASAAARSRAPTTRERARRARSSCSSTSTSTRPGSACGGSDAAARPGRGASSGGSTTSARRSTARSPTRSSQATTATASCSPPPASTTSAAALDRLGELVPGDGPVALVADSDRDGHLRRAGAGGARRPARLRRTSCRRARRRSDWPVVDAALARAAARPRRDGRRARRRLHDRRRRASRPRPTCAACRGSRCRRRSSARSTRRSAARPAIDIPEGKNLVGAFHWPARVVLDETLLETLPERERRQGMAELVKTRLLAGRKLDVRGAAAYKAALCLRTRTTAAPRRWLNLGHTFAHALEAAADFDLPHGEAVALGLLAALRLSGRDTARGRGGARPAAGRGRPRAGLAGAAARQEAERATRSTSSCSATTGPYVEARPADEVRRELETADRVGSGDAGPGAERRQSRHARPPRPDDLRRALARTSSRRRSTRGRTSSTSPRAAGRRTARASTSTGSTTRTANVDGVVVNPGAWSHYSYAIRDALEILEVPIVEVHLSDIDAPRGVAAALSVVADLAAHRVIGKGPEGYREALEFLAGKVERVTPRLDSARARSSSSRCSSRTSSTSAT